MFHCPFHFSGQWLVARRLLLPIRLEPFPRRLPLWSSSPSLPPQPISGSHGLPAIKIIQAIVTSGFPFVQKVLAQERVDALDCEESVEWAGKSCILENCFCLSTVWGNSFLPVWGYLPVSKSVRLCIVDHVKDKVPI